MSRNAYKGTSKEQDPRYKNAGKRSLPVVFNTPVSRNNIKLRYIRPWIKKRTFEILGLEDEVLNNMIYEILDNAQEINAEQLIDDISGFLEDNAMAFATDLWRLLLQAQEDPEAIPASIRQEREVEEKKRKLDRKIRRERSPRTNK